MRGDTRLRGMTSDPQNMTPLQRSMPRAVQAEAYERVEMTCTTTRAILDEAATSIMSDFDIDPADEALLDASMSRAFRRLRDEVAQRFRDEQMILLDAVRNGTAVESTPQQTT